MAISRRRVISIAPLTIGVALLASCSDGGIGGGSTKNLNPAAVSRFINEYYHKSFESSVENFKNGQELDSEMKSILGNDRYDELIKAEDPFFVMSELDENSKKSLSEAVSKFNTSSELYDFTDLNSDQSLYLNLSVIALNNQLPMAWQEAEFSISAPESKIEFDGREARVKHTDLTYVYDGRPQKVTVMPGGAEYLNMILVDDTWKINGKKHLEQLLRLGVGLFGS